MCIYVQSPLSEPISYLVHPTASGSDSLFGTTRSQGDHGFYKSPYFNYINTNSSQEQGELYHDDHVSAEGTYLTASERAGAIKPNGVYTGNQHPSDKISAYDSSLKTTTAAAGSASNYEGVVYLDQSFSVGSATSGYSKTQETSPFLGEYQKRGKVFGDGGGHMFGYATCHWLRACVPQNMEIDGSACSATLSGVLYKGFCFRSDTGSLECGHATALDNEYGERPIAFDAASIKPADLTALPASQKSSAATVRSPFVLPSQDGVVPDSTYSLTTVDSTPGAEFSSGFTPAPAYRCPTGSPAKTLGSYVSKRMLIAGCMNPADDQYDSIAEVHVPAYCVDSSDYKKGCLIPWAKNFDPTAKQSGKCLFVVKGCTDPDSVNYNSEASMEDPDKPCIKRVTGCTVNNATYTSMAYSSTYKSIDTDTPEFKSGVYGSKKRLESGSPEYWPGETYELNTATLGVPSVYAGVTVASYDPAANVLSSCVVAVEGCMDASAANYDADATVNSHSWCIPKVSGCMMPATTVATPTKFVRPTSSGDGIFMGDGLNPYWSALISVHVPSMCVTARYGCMESGAENYDPLANIQTRCWHLQYGCLDPQAVNFGCSNNEFKSKCNGEPGMLPDGNVTHHQERACLFPWNFSPDPPAPPSPRFPSNIDMESDLVVVQHNQIVTLEVGGDLNEWGPNKRCQFAADFYGVVVEAEAEAAGTAPGSKTCCCNDILPDRQGVPTATPNGYGPDCGLDTETPDDDLPMCYALVVTAGSVVLENKKIFAEATAAQGAAAAIDSKLGGSADAAQLALGELTGLTILRAPIVQVVEEITIKDVDFFNATAASVTVTGGMIFCIAMVALYYYMKKGRGAKKPVYPA